MFGSLFLMLSIIGSITNGYTNGYTIGIDNSIVNANNSFDKYKYPVVLLHGITSDASELKPVVEWLTGFLPEDKIFNLEVGNGKPNSIFKTMNWQLNALCHTIYNIPQLENGFNFIGMSQGGLLARGYVQRCNRYPVRNLITWVSPQAGVYGFNEVHFNWDDVYTPFYQNLYSFAGYWKNPNKYYEYLERSIFLPYLNNESPRIDKYNEYGFDYILNKERILSLTNFVMIWSPNDDVITPPQSGRFEFYEILIPKPLSITIPMHDNIHIHNNREKRVLDTEDLKIQDFFLSRQYQEDLLGLQTLFHNGKLHMLETNCTHSGHKTPACFSQLEELTIRFLI